MKKDDETMFNQSRERTQRTKQRQPVNEEQIKRRDKVKGWTRHDKRAEVQ